MKMGISLRILCVALISVASAAEATVWGVKSQFGAGGSTVPAHLFRFEPGDLSVVDRDGLTEAERQRFDPLAAMVMDSVWMQIDLLPDTGAGPPAEMRMAAEQIAAETAEAGFVLVESHDFLPREWLLVFATAEA
jgi:hypothetical protein